MTTYEVCFVKCEVDLFSGSYGVVDSAKVTVVASNRDEAREKAIQLLKPTALYQWAWTDVRGEAQ